MHNQPDNMMDAMWMIILVLMTGAMIGLVFHHWPMPVNNSVFIPNQKGKK